MWNEIMANLTAEQVATIVVWLIGGVAITALAWVFWRH